MRAGTIRATLVFQRQTTDRDDSGQLLDEWSEIAPPVRAAVLPVSGRKYFNASGERAEITHEIRMRYRAALSDLKPRDRAVYGTRIFDIQSVIDVRDRHREIHLMVTEHV